MHVASFSCEVPVLQLGSGHMVIMTVRRLSKGPSPYVPLQILSPRVRRELTCIARSILLDLAPWSQCGWSCLFGFEKQPYSKQSEFNRATSLLATAYVHQRLALRISRARMTRMISLVPSKICITRTSRKFRSTP